MRSFLSILLLILFGFGSQGQTINLFAGNYNYGGYLGDGGAATSAQIGLPKGLATDNLGNIYISDVLNHVIRKISPIGIISTYAGNGIAGYTGDGGAAISASLNEPYGLSVDIAGNLYIADSKNNAIRKVSTSGIISTAAGNGLAAYSGDGGSATSASLNYPFAVITDNTGNMFISDMRNNVIRKVNPTGVISTYAGTGAEGYSGDGAACAFACFRWPHGLAFDNADNLYVADMDNNVVRKISSSGIISTFAGNGYGAGSTYGGYSGDGGAATAAALFWPSYIAFDNYQNLYISDNIKAIRKVTPSGNITTYAGNGSLSGSGDGGPAIDACLHDPSGIAVDAGGRLYVADTRDMVVRMVSGTTSINNVQSASTLEIFPNPSKSIVNINSQEGGSYRLLTLTGLVVKSGTLKKEDVISIDHLCSGVYILEIAGNDGTPVTVPLFKE